MRVFDYDKVKSGVGQLLEGLGVDVDDADFKDTPARVARAFKEFCSGLYVPTEDIVSMLGRTFPTGEPEMVFVGPMNAVSLCPHHLLPVRYTAYFAYLPNENVIGLSKISRFVSVMASRPIKQEDLATDIVTMFMEHVEPQGAALTLDGAHGCMTERGVKQHCCKAGVNAFRGVFRDRTGMKTEFFDAIQRRMQGA